MLGIDPSSLPCIAPDPAPPADPYEDSVPDKEARVRAVGAEWLEDYYGRRDSFTWKNDGHRVPIDVMQRVFTFDEQCRIWMAGVIMSRLSEHFEAAHPMLEKVRLSMWHHGFERGFNAFARGVNGLRRLTWEGAEVRLVHTNKWRCDGYAEGTPKGEPGLWIDNDLGALIYIGGKRVLTVGFGIGETGIYLTQVQLRAKKGNRFLYKLRAHYLDVAIDMLARAFDGAPLWIIDGMSAARAVRRSYGATPCNMTADDETRIAALYDRPLAGYARSTVTKNHNGRVYARLDAARELKLAA